MNTVLLILHLIVSCVLIGLVLLQSSQGGLRSEFGGEMYRSKRGAEKLVFGGTILFSALFLITSIASLLVR